jgi:hypothetical protein
VRAFREEQRRKPAELAEGLRKWLRGKDTDETEAASSIAAEALIRWLDKLEKGGE